MDLFKRPPANYPDLKVLLDVLIILFDCDRYEGDKKYCIMFLAFL